MLSRIVNDLEIPAAKWPSLVLLTGDAVQSVEMRQVFAKTEGRRTSKLTVGVRLKTDFDTAYSDYPVFIAENHIPRTINLSEEPEEMASCHVNNLQDIPWLSENPRKAIDQLSCKLIHPFADVICLFVLQNDSTSSIASKLMIWSEEEKASRTGSLWLPHVVVVCAASETRSPSELQSQLIALARQQSPDADLSIFSRTSFYVPKDSIRTLKDHIRCEIDIIRNVRVRTQSLFSAAHLDRLFRLACDHFVVSGQDPFNMISASRQHRPVNPDLGSCIADLLQSIRSFGEVTEVAVPFIAECLLMDNYSPDVHGPIPSLTASV